MPIDFRVEAIADWPNYEWKTAGTFSDQINLSSLQATSGFNSIQYKVRTGDNTATNQQRAEGTWQDSDEHLFEGEWKWYAWSTMFESPWIVPSNWGHYTQFHADENFSQAPIKFDSTNGSGTFRLTLKLNTGQENAGGTTWTQNTRHTLLTSPQTDVWYDHILGVKWERTAIGAIRVLLRNRSSEDLFTEVLSLDNVPTLIWKVVDDEDHLGDMYLKQGFYRNDTTGTNTIYHDGMRRGDRLEEVAADWGFTGFLEAPVAVSPNSLSLTPAPSLEL